MIKQCYYQNVQYMMVENEDLEEQKPSVILSSLGLKTPLSKVALLDNILF